MTKTVTDPPAPPACFYCGRTGQPLAPCCHHHPDTPVCADVAACRDYLLAGLR